MIVNILYIYNGKASTMIVMIILIMMIVMIMMIMMIMMEIVDNRWFTWKYDIWNLFRRPHLYNLFGGLLKWGYPQSSI